MAGDVDWSADVDVMPRYGTFVEGGAVYVESGDGAVEVGSLDEVIEGVGGPAWTISYTAAEKRRYPEEVTADEGLTVDVVDMMRTMTHGERFVATLAACPAEASGDAVLSPRMGLFVGKLLENLENGLD
ncbi:hypothetical protein [Halomicrobium urmianum]|uniref:hypothetical protein n=1 Tax=Halomicrobium urmianum TaxID=1586233 RepID=UPI001CD936A7|nr:hypothetical protein [Halomicrobium urmianum]